MYTFVQVEAHFVGDKTVRWWPKSSSMLRNVVSTSNKVDMNRYQDKITELQLEFGQQLLIFHVLETDFTFSFSLLTVNASSQAANIELEMINLQCDSDLKNKFVFVDLDIFYLYFLPEYPNLVTLAVKVLCMFGTTYLGEQVFSVITSTKQRFAQVSLSST